MLLHKKHCRSPTEGNMERDVQLRKKHGRTQAAIKVGAEMLLYKNHCISPTEVNKGDNIPQGEDHHRPPMEENVNNDEFPDVTIAGEFKKKMTHRNRIKFTCEICMETSTRKGFLSKHIIKHKLNLKETQVKFVPSSGELM